MLTRDDGPESPYGEALGRAIQVLRTERGISRAELAKRAGLSYSYLSELETGRKGGNTKTFFLLANALGVTPRELHALVEERVLPTMAAPRAESAFDETLAEPSETPRRSWFRGARVAPPDTSPRRGPSASPAALDEARAELDAILAGLSPEDRALLLEFARRLGR